MTGMGRALQIVAIASSSKSAMPELDATDATRTSPLRLIRNFTITTPELLKDVKGLSEETTTGVHRLYEMHKKRSEEHTSELQSLMRISYAVFCLKKTKNSNQQNNRN